MTGNHLTPKEAMELQETALRHCHLTEHGLQEEAETLQTTACTGAYILARAAFIAHASLEPKQRQSMKHIKDYRTLARAMLEDVLDDVELMMTETKGRA